MNRRSLFAIIAGAPLAAMAAVKAMAATSDGARGIAVAPIETMPDELIRIYSYPLGWIKEIPSRQYFQFRQADWRKTPPEYELEYVDGPDGEPLLIEQRAVWPDGVKCIRRTRHHPECANMPHGINGWYVSDWSKT